MNLSPAGQKRLSALRAALAAGLPLASLLSADAQPSPAGTSGAWRVPGNPVIRRETPPPPMLGAPVPPEFLPELSGSPPLPPPTVQPREYPTVSLKEYEFPDAIPPPRSSPAPESP